MSLCLNHDEWRRVQLGDVVTTLKETVDPTGGSVDRYVAGEHMGSDDLRISKWGDVGETDLGPAFHRRFRAGQVLYGSRRTYLRKVAVAEFDGVCANTTFVLETKDQDVLLQQFLPFVLTAEPFHAFAIAESKGSVNPYVNWSDIARYEFSLPPVAEQRRIADLLWAAEWHRRALVESREVLAEADAEWTTEMFSNLDWSITLADAVDPRRPLCYGVVQPGVDARKGVPMIRVLDMEGGAPELESLKRIAPEVDTQYKRSRVVAGDVLVSVVGTIGRSWVVTPEFVGANVARAIARVSPRAEVVRSDFLQWVIGSRRVQGALNAAAFESARKTLNLSVLAKVALPRVALSEQGRLLDLRARFASANVESRTESEEVAHLGAAVLSQVFGSPA